MDRKLAAETFALVLMCAAFTVTSIGFGHDSTAIWGLGLALLTVGGLIPVATRYMNHDDDTVRDTGVEYDDRLS